MIKTKIRGRLGNQLFIYAFVRMLSVKLGENILIYDRKDEEDNTWHSHLDHYKLCNEIEFTSKKSDVMDLGLWRKILYFADRILNLKSGYAGRKHFEDKCRNLYIKNGLIICENGYFDIPNELPHNLFCAGYFQSPRFFDSIRDVLIEELQPKEPIMNENKAFVAQIKESESVCITIRLGDFMGNSLHQVCTKQYYYAAINKMKEQLPNCKFFVFSDEIEKVKEIFGFDDSFIFDSGKSPDYESLRCMSYCKHFILSNSTFSWWAEYLSTNDKKIVISPRKWYADDTMPCDIQEDNWIYI